MKAAADAPHSPSDFPLTEQFLQYGRYVRGWSPATVIVYRLALRECPTIVTKAHLNAIVIAMRERGLSPGGINVRIRSINSYLTWLHEEGHVSERLRIKVLKNPPKPIQTLTDKDIRLLAMFKPKGRMQTRTWVLAMTLLDCGLRISEALTLQRDHVDLENLALRVRGKGDKERLVPISVELRKHLHRFLRQTTGRFVFADKVRPTDVWRRAVGTAQREHRTAAPVQVHRHHHARSRTWIPPRLRGSRHEERAGCVPAVAHPRAFEHQHDADLSAGNRL